GGGWEATTFDSLGYFWMQGGRLLDPSGKPVFASGANRQKMLNVLRFEQRLIASGATPSRVATFNTYDEMATAAQAGTVAMFLGGSFQWPQMKEAMGKAFAKWQGVGVAGPESGQTASWNGRLVVEQCFR